MTYLRAHHALWHAHGRSCWTSKRPLHRRQLGTHCVHPHAEKPSLHGQLLEVLLCQVLLLGSMMLM